MVFSAVAGVLVGCHERQTVTEGRAAGSPSLAVAANDFQIGAQSAVSATKTFIAENKDQFVAVTQRQLQSVDSVVSDLARKSENYRDDAKAQAESLLLKVKERREAATRKLEELRAASKETWSSTKSGFASSLEDLHEALNDARSKIN